MKQRLFFEWFFLVAFWIVYSVGFSSILIAQSRILLDILDMESVLDNNPYMNYSLSAFQYLEATLLGLLFGSLFFFINRISEKPIITQKSTGHVILLKSLFYLLALLLVYGLVALVLIVFRILPDGYIRWGLSLELDPIYFLPYSYFAIFGILLTNFLLQVNQKYGGSHLLPIFLGKYRRPLVERRIFMFIDLKSSTQYAEELGHIRYSQLIQDCFMILNRLVYRYKAEIYQYVGDEIVLTWQEGEGIKNLNCIKVFFAFQDDIRSQSKYFMDKYGLIPEFKVGLNTGEITAAEIGVIKREIAYHGDTINTASRIQEQCNVLNKSFLASESITQQLNALNGYSKNLIGDVTLKGKRGKVRIYSIEENQ